MKFGIQTETYGGSRPPLANSSANLLNRMNEKASTMPIPMCSPVPPRTFRDESDTPMIVKMNVETG